MDGAVQSASGNLWLLKAVVAIAIMPLWSDWARRHVGGFIHQAGRSRTLALFAVTRFVPILLAVPVAGLKLPEDSVEWARLISAHEFGPYSAGFAFIPMVLSWGHVTPMVLVLTMIAAEVVAFAVFWSAVASRVDEPIVLGLLAFWIVNPVSLFHISLGGQDEALILLGWCAAFWAVLRGRPRVAGVLIVLSVLFSKILGLVACLPLFSTPRRQVWKGLAMVGGGMMAAGLVAASFANISLLGFMDEFPYLTSGNVWALVEILRPGRSNAIVVGQFVTAAMAGAAAVGLLNRRPLSDPLWQCLRITGTAGCVFLFLSPKSPTAWLIMFLPGVLFLILTMGPRAKAVVLVAFLPATAFEPSLWHYFDQGGTLDRTAWGLPGVLVVDACLLAGYALLIGQGLRLRDPMPLHNITRVRTVVDPA